MWWGLHKGHVKGLRKIYCSLSQKQHVWRFCQGFLEHEKPTCEPVCFIKTEASPETDSGTIPASSCQEAWSLFFQIEDKTIHQPLLSTIHIIEEKDTALWLQQDHSNEEKCSSQIWQHLLSWLVLVFDFSSEFCLRSVITRSLINQEVQH